MALQHAAEGVQVVHQLSQTTGDSGDVPAAAADPAGFAQVLGDLHFGKTRRNIADNPEVAISVTGPEPKQGFQLKGTASVHQSGEPFEKLGALLRDAGVDTEPHAAVLVSVAEVYLLDPGPNAGKRVL